MRVCSEVTCGCSTVDCYKITEHGDLFIFSHEDNNKQYSLTRDIFLSFVKSKSMKIAGQNLNRSAIEKLYDAYGNL